MPRYYYTDELKMIWMMREFNFRFISYHYDIFEGDQIFDWKKICSHGHPYYNAIGYYDNLQDTNKIYIHPDSVPLLQPQEGDRNIDGLIFEKGQWIGLGYASSGYLYNNRDIDKRNNKVWFAPEVEEINEKII